MGKGSQLFSMTVPFQSGIAAPEALDGPAYWFAFAGDRLLVETINGCKTVPCSLAPAPGTLPKEEFRFLGRYNGTSCYAAEIEDPGSLHEEDRFLTLRETAEQMDNDLFAIAGRAIQILKWLKTHRFCGQCGKPMTDKPDELARECTDCSLVIYPRISPAVIMSVERGDEILLARSSRFPKGMYSTLAGFVDPGETLEDAVRREVMEEVGIQVSDIRYFGSQPWPFPNSLMLGFTAVYEQGELDINRSELEDARWFSVRDLPRKPSRISIARALIDHFIERRTR